MEKVNVLSLFDGISCGRIALARAGVGIKRYAAYEIDNFAVQISKKNYPDIERYGDVTKADFSQFKGFDFVIGGSPCQGFSFVGNQLNFSDERSRLFFEFARAVKEVKPRYFLLENVKMKKEFQDTISEWLGVQPIEINSSLVSAQNRKRLYWTNIKGVDQPEDKKIYVDDILEDIESGQTVINKAQGDKARCLRATSYKDGTRNFIATNVDRKTCVAIKQKEYGKGVYEVKNGKIQYNGKEFENELSDGLYKFRKLTPVEFERLQTLPDNYTEGISKTQRYKTIGNGWTVDVIAHILSCAKRKMREI